MLCPLTQLPDGRWKCTDCNQPILPAFIGRAAISGGECKRRCQADDTDITEAAERLGVIEKAKHYAEALARWTRAKPPEWANRWPTRTAEEVQRIYAEHCETCEQLELGACKICGCNVRTEGLAIKNKLKMATEHCDLGKW